MAEWSKLEDNICMHQCNETINSKELNQHSYFVELVSRFLKSCSSHDCFTPLPPMLGNGHCVDLLKLYFVVKQKGGFDVVSECKLWGEVGLHCGLDSRFGSAFKLIFAKYLSSFESWIVKIDKENAMERKLLMKLESDYGVYVSKIDGSCSLKLEKSGVSFIDLTNGDDKNESKKFEKSGVSFIDLTNGDDKNESKKFEKSGVSFIDLTNGDDKNESKKFDWKKVLTDYVGSESSNERNDESMKSKQQNVKTCFTDVGDSTIGNGESVISNQNYAVTDSGGGHIEENQGGESLKQGKSEMTIDCVSSDVSDNQRFSASPVLADDAVKSTQKSVDFMKGLIEPDGVSKEVSSHKRKRDCYSEMLRWMVNVAKDPTDPAVIRTPKRSKRALYGNDNNWKQALLTRKSLFLKKIRTRSVDQSSPQKKQKTLPFLSTSNQNEATPLSPRQRPKARLGMQLPASNHSQQRPYARNAEVPEWTGKAIEESDSKWLGTRIWPLEKTENKLLIERDPIGKGRTDGCGCQFRGSTECIKFHVSERRIKKRLELGSAFYAWKFDKMGEDCSDSWTTDEERKFKMVVRENLQTSERSLWKPMCKALPKKKWVDQVRYYYNVFMLRRRSYQNRHYPSDVDSGDDETEYRSTNNSVRHGTA